MDAGEEWATLADVELIPGSSIVEYPTLSATGGVDCDGWGLDLGAIPHRAADRVQQNDAAARDQLGAVTVITRRGT